MKKGFTLLELVIMIAIMVIVCTIIFNVFASLNNRQTVDGTAETVKALLEKAQSLTLASQGGTQYGVHFASSSVVLFSGTSYSVANADNATTTLSSKVVIYNVSLNGGGTDVVFNRLTGNTTNYGTTTITLVSSTTTQRQVIVSQTGSVQYQ